MNLGILLSSLYIVQYLIFDKVKFLHVISSVRFGDTRLHFESFIIYLSLYFILNEILDKYKFKYLIYIFIEFIFLAVVLKARLVLVAIVISTLIVILLKKSCERPIIIYFLIWISIISMSIPNSIVREYVDSIVYEVSNEDGNHEVRNNGKKFYKESIKDKILHYKEKN